MESPLRKRCSCCDAVKALDEFQVRRVSADGRTASCKECLRKRDKARYPKEREARHQLMRDYVATERGRRNSNAAKRRYIQRHPTERAAHVEVGNAIRDGRLRTQPCAVCTREDVEGHHPDYSNPLAVVWLCVEHHNQLHVDHAEHLRAISSC